MANVMAKLVIFSILLNLAAAITMTAVVDIDGNKVFDRTSQTGFQTSGTEEYSDNYITELEQTINPSGLTEDASDQVYRVLDTIGLGFIYRFINVVDEYMYGFVNLMDNMFGPSLEDDTRAILFGEDGNFGVLKSIITISYILMGIYLFTGKDVVENS